MRTLIEYKIEHAAGLKREMKLPADGNIIGVRCASSMTGGVVPVISVLANGEQGTIGKTERFFVFWRQGPIFDVPHDDLIFVGSAVPLGANGHGAKEPVYVFAAPVEDDDAMPEVL